MKRYLFIAIVLMASCKQEEKKPLPVAPSESLTIKTNVPDTEMEFPSTIVDMNKGLPKGTTIADLLQRQAAVLGSLKSVLGNKEYTFDIGLSSDSTYFEAEIYTPENAAGHSQGSRFFFFPKTGKLFSYTLGSDSLTLHEIPYDTLKHKF